MAQNKFGDTKVTGDLEVTGDVSPGTVTNPTVVGTATINSSDDTDLSGEGVDNIQDNGLILNGTSAIDKQIRFQVDGVDKWLIQGAWREEDGEFLYFLNADSKENVFNFTRNGRFSFNSPTNLVLPISVFDGTGENDITPSGWYDGTITRGFLITIDGETPDTFTWQVTTDGVNYTTGGTSVAVDTDSIELGYGVSIKFDSLTGHVTGDEFGFRCFPQQSLDTISIRPPMFHYVMESYSGDFVNITYASGSTHCAVNSDRTIIEDTNSITYLGNDSKFSSTYFLFNSVGGNVTLVVEYWNGTSWEQLTYADHYFRDNTNSMTQNGSINWDKTRLSDWVKNEVNSVSAFWIRVRSTTVPSPVPNISAITRHTDYHMAIYAAHLDTRRKFAVRGDGMTEIFEADRTSTADSYRQDEYITEKRLTGALSLFVDNIFFLNTDYNIVDDLPASAFQKTISWSGQQDVPQLLGTWLFTDAYSEDTILANIKFETYLYLSRSSSNRSVSFYTELIKYTDSETISVLAESVELIAPSTTTPEAYSFKLFLSENVTMGETDKLGIRVYAVPKTVHSQSATLYGGLGYPSILESSNLTSFSSLIPYSGAYKDVDLGTKEMKAGSFKLSALNTAPANATDTGTTGDIRIVDGYIYVCVSTDTWKRAELTTW